MENLVIEKIRCFHARQIGPLRPITLLVGENSSGKSTFLALLRAAWHVASGNPSPDFNEEPFPLGAYEQIASYRGGAGGRAKSFTIGIDSKVTLSSDGSAIVARLRGTFESVRGQPTLKNWTLEASDIRLDLSFDHKGEIATGVVKCPSGPYEVPSYAFSNPFPLPTISFFLSHTRQFDTQKPEHESFEQRNSELKRAGDIISGFVASLGQRPYAFAPIRTRPKRTYDPLKDIPEPEGSHIPMVLAHTFSDNQEDWKMLAESLSEFGRASGLFTEILVRRMGQKESDPFQLRVKVSGPAFNLVDVGYGVSQILPIIVDCFRQESGGTFLLQQPEVHLHPRAQAALGGFLGSLAAHQGKRFVVETHSDYLIDRIRMDVRDRKYLKESDVSILYFDRRKRGVRIHHLELDAFGNICKAPKGYRDFFLSEEKRLLGIE